MDDLARFAALARDRRLAQLTPTVANFPDDRTHDALSGPDPFWASAPTEAQPLQGAGPVNGNGLILEYSDGRREHTSNGAEFLKKLAQAGPGSIKHLTIRAHGGSDNVGLDPKYDSESILLGDSPVRGRRLYLHLNGGNSKENVDLAEFKDRFSPDAEIEIRACNTANGEQNLAQGMSEILGVRVRACEGEYREFRIPGILSVDIGPAHEKVYENGREVQKR